MVSQALVFEQVITGISIGSQLFLVAVGLSLIFGVLDILNFTHGILYMLGAYMPIVLIDEALGTYWMGVLLLAWVVVAVGVVGERLAGVDLGRFSLPVGWVVGGLAVVLAWFGIARGPLVALATAAESLIGPFGLGVVVAAGFVGQVGILLETRLISRVYDRGHLDQLLLTFALVLILTDATRFVFGSGSHVIDPPTLLQGDIQLVGSFSIPTYRGFVIAMSLVVMAALFAVLRTTNLGRMVRATSSDRDMALLLGIDVPGLYTAVFFIGAALAGLGGALAAPLQSVTPELGNQVIINAFVVVVIGGLGSFTGAFVGAYLIGLMIAVGSLVVAGAGQLMPFVAMIIILLLKPEGLFGGVEA